jgi:uncharacterized membrane protein
MWLLFGKKMITCFLKMPARRFRTGELFHFGVAVIAHLPPSP